MARPCTKEFREEILSYVSEKGWSVEEVSAFFDISESVVYAWRKQLRETGDVSPRKRENKPRKANYEELLRIVRENPSLLQVEIAKMINMSRSGVSAALCRLGIVKKKGSPHTKKQILKNKKNS